MKRRTKKILDKKLQGGISTYVFIMLGTSIILYMFGFTNMLGSGLPGGQGYLANASLEDNDANTSVTNPDLQYTANPLQMLLDGILRFFTANPLYVVGGLAGLIGVSLLAFFTKINLSVLYQYIIPIAILWVFLNYIVFPINPASADLQQMSIGENISISVVLTIFFNVWFIMAIIAYVRSAET